MLLSGSGIDHDCLVRVLSLLLEREIVFVLVVALKLVSIDLVDVLLKFSILIVYAAHHYSSLKFVSRCKSGTEVLFRGTGPVRHPKVDSLCAYLAADLGV